LTVIDDLVAISLKSLAG